MSSSDENGNSSLVTLRRRNVLVYSAAIDFMTATAYCCSVAMVVVCWDMRWSTILDIISGFRIAEESCDSSSWITRLNMMSRFLYDSRSK